MVVVVVVVVRGFHSDYRAPPSFSNILDKLGMMTMWSCLLETDILLCMGWSRCRAALIEAFMKRIYKEWKDEVRIGEQTVGRCFHYSCVYLSPARVAAVINLRVPDVQNKHMLVTAGTLWPFGQLSLTASVTLNTFIESCPRDFLSYPHPL